MALRYKVTTTTWKVGALVVTAAFGESSFLVLSSGECSGVTDGVKKAKAWIAGQATTVEPVPKGF
jgi:hypothetical protein